MSDLADRLELHFSKEPGWKPVTVAVDCGLVEETIARLRANERDAAEIVDKINRFYDFLLLTEARSAARRIAGEDNVG